jgi:hypothetical protein
MKKVRGRIAEWERPGIPSFGWRSEQALENRETWGTWLFMIQVNVSSISKRLKERLLTEKELKAKAADRSVRSTLKPANRTVQPSQTAAIPGDFK